MDVYNTHTLCAVLNNSFMQYPTKLQMYVYVQKPLKAMILFINCTRAFESIDREKIEQILPAYGLPKETVAAIMMLYKNTSLKPAPCMETQTTSIL